MNLLHIKNIFSKIYIVIRFYTILSNIQTFNIQNFVKFGETNYNINKEKMVS
jgi:hypothetical protein